MQCLALSLIIASRCRVELCCACQNGQPPCAWCPAVGTFVYSAPEMLIGNDSGVKADIYSFGVVLWEIVTGAIAKRGRLHDPKVQP